MSGLRAKNDAVKQYMKYANEIGYKPVNVNLRYLNASQIKTKLAELKKQYKNQKPPTYNVGKLAQKNKVNRDRAKIAKQIREFVPKFRMSKRDTYNELIKKLAEVKTGLRGELKTFLEKATVEDKIEVDARILADFANDLKLYSDKYLLMSSDGQFYALNNIDDFKKELAKHASGYDLVETQETHGSDVAFVYELLSKNQKVTLEFKSKALTDGRKLNSGAFFQYYNISQFDLKRYQIFKQHESMKSDTEACILYALRQYGIAEATIDELKLKAFTKELRVADLTAIAKHLGVAIKLQYDEQYKVLNKGAKEVIQIGLIENHYFLNDTTNITSYAIQDYETAIQDPKFPMCRNQRTRRMEKPLSAFKAIKLMIKQGGFFEPITLSNIQDMQTVSKLIDYKELRAPKRECACNKPIASCKCTKSQIKLQEYKPYSKTSKPQIFQGHFNKNNNPNDNHYVWFIDTETSNEHGYHQALCLCAIRYIPKLNSLEEFTYYGPDCVKQFLDSLNKHALIYAHNMAFDVRQFIDHLEDISSPIESGTKLKSLSAKYGYYHLSFKDSYSFLTCKLSAMSSMFDLAVGDKDAYPYTLLTEENSRAHIPLETCYEHLKQEQIDDFTHNAIKIGALNQDNNLVDFELYTKHYCMQDTRILAQAFTTFRKQIMQVTNIDIFTMLSLPQLANQYLIDQECYNGCYAISGIASDFIRRCVVGGRCMIAKNESYHVKIEGDSTIVNGVNTQDDLNKGALADFDAVSLYPSAMARMNGFIKGLPKVLSQEQIEQFETQKQAMDAYFVEIEVLSVDIHREFPLLSIKNKQGIRKFTNELIGNKFYVDNTALEDLVQYQAITYKIIRGYYFDQGFNTQIKRTIRFMFQERLNLKAQKNPLQLVYKLLMNASYGKLIQKPITNTKTFVTADKINAFVTRHFKYITSYSQVNQDLYVVRRKKSFIDHFTGAHIATNILSMSKRIMNEVICTAEDLGIKIYYQDTDSMHLHQDTIKLLRDTYKQKYGRELIGKDMGQFHTDFEVSDNKATNIAAVESIFVAKKVYVDKLQYNDANGEIKYDHHVRVKGVPTQAILDIDANVMDTYKRLYQGEPITCNIAKYCVLQLDKDYRARANTRCVQRVIKK